VITLGASGVSNRLVSPTMMTGTEILRSKTAPPPPITEVGAGAPEPAKCTVGGLLRGCNGGWCLVRPIPYCEFGFVYGLGYLCRHPEIQRIIARTQATNSASSR
jgi:hypothetical protein